MDNPRLLIIDDDVAICESLIDILELKGYLVDTSHNAEDGIKTSGFGFGLALCKTIMEKHGGDITAQSGTMEKLDGIN
ncbi:MAG: ATP-binding protein [Candidatus Scalindua sp.]